MLDKAVNSTMSTCFTMKYVVEITRCVNVYMQITRSVITEVFYTLTKLNLLKDCKEKKKPIWLYLFCFLEMLAQLNTVPDGKL